MGSTIKMGQFALRWMLSMAVKFCRVNAALYFRVCVCLTRFSLCLFKMVGIGLTVIRSERTLPNLPEVTVWDDRQKLYRAYLANEQGWKAMDEAGLLKPDPDLIVLMQDLDPSINPGMAGAQLSAYQDTRPILFSVLRLHTRLTPNTTVMVVDWNRALRGGPIRRTASAATYGIPMSDFIVQAGSRYRVHCIGAGFGMHACSSVCKQLKWLTRDPCERIVGLHPPVIGRNRLAKSDANYIAVLGLSSESFAVSHELIRVDKGNGIHPSCPTLGGWSGTVCAESVWGEVFCEAVQVTNWVGMSLRSAESCSKAMVVVSFMKGLDSSQALGLVGETSDKSVEINAWNSYTVSVRDVPRNASEVSARWFSQQDSADLHSGSILVLATRSGFSYLWNSDKYYSKSYGEYNVRWYLTQLSGDVVDVYTTAKALLLYARIYRPISKAANSMQGMPGFHVYSTRCVRSYTYLLSGHRLYKCFLRTPEIVYGYREQIGAAPFNETGQWCPAYPGVRYDPQLEEFRIPVTAAIGEKGDLSGLLQTGHGLYLVAVDVVYYALDSEERRTAQSYRRLCPSGDDWSIEIDEKASYLMFTAKVSGMYEVRLHYEVMRVAVSVHVPERVKSRLTRDHPCPLPPPGRLEVAGPPICVEKGQLYNYSLAFWGQEDTDRWDQNKSVEVVIGSCESGVGDRVQILKFNGSVGLIFQEVGEHNISLIVGEGGVMQSFIVSVSCLSGGGSEIGSTVEVVNGTSSPREEFHKDWTSAHVTQMRLSASPDRSVTSSALRMTRASSAPTNVSATDAEPATDKSPPPNTPRYMSSLPTGAPPAGADAQSGQVGSASSGGSIPGWAVFLIVSAALSTILSVALVVHWCSGRRVTYTPQVGVSRNWL